ncbi:hypothetical protein AMAG_01248 [Allomyces macrogynus ATCC 38327]|uniref:Peptidase M3A/M3B catalytic domain-containing protein n=1 Tax=Allomyces macrogynus (strain ATCC 38327) TaxID=578462 RepID=A0A0L0RY71_ALLM3|nr:hypothetical protein AMAG_01248 [Allomyces macrogynus ATCC 38327]|eukprot:KNE55347.1 hypothetical protein AMAG_01248 [Allomyces macrogynus ATCC 38327]
MPVPTPAAADLHFALTAEDVRAIGDRIIRASTRVFDEIAALDEAECTFESVIVRMAKLENMAGSEAARASFMQNVAVDKATRDASQEVSQQLEEFEIESSMREDLYRAVRAAASKLPADVDDEDRRLVERQLQQFERNGLALPTDKREELKQIKKRLAELGIQFSRNKAEDATFVPLTAEELDGMPADYLESLTKLDDGRYKVTMSYPDRLPCMRKARNSETRKKLEEAATRMCPENVGLLEEMVVLRAKAAALLGFQTHAAYKLEINMAKKPETVLSFLDDLKTKLMPLGQHDYDQLLEIKKAEREQLGLPAENQLFAWDLAYYNNLLIERDFDVDHELVKQYFPFEIVTKGMLSLYSKILGITFKQATDVAVWHSDVTVWHVHDTETKDYIGTFFLDLHPREGAYKHAAVFPLRPACRLADGGYQTPVAAMKANFSKSGTDAPSLCKHDELVTYYHELGHVMHVILSQTKYARFHGTSVAGDFVEAPSQMLENWCWEPEILEFLSSHWKSGEKIPADLVARLVKTEHVNGGLMNLRQIFFGLFDMTLHTRDPASETPVESTNLYNSLRKDVTLLPAPEDSFGHATFDHLAGGYDAGYYGYLWSKVFAADMYWSRFKVDGITNPKVGLDYRRCILHPGASRDEMDLLIDFLGRKPTSDAFLKSLGL